MPPTLVGWALHAIADVRHLVMTLHMYEELMFMQWCPGFLVW